MCGRYAMRLEIEDLKHAIEDAGLPIDEVKSSEKVHPSWNVAPRSHSMIYCKPTKDIFALKAMQWTLQPSYAKEPVKYPSFNTRCESLNPLKPAWQCAKSRRGIVFMNGYYEWQRRNKEKLPFYISNPSKALLAVLVVWDTSSLVECPTYSIVTTSAAPDLEYIHPRMPVVTTYEGAKRWIEGTWPDVLDVVHPKPGLESFRVAQDVNKVGVDRPGLNDRIEDKKTLPTSPKKERPVTEWFTSAKPAKRGTSTESEAKKKQKID